MYLYEGQIDIFFFKKGSSQHNLDSHCQKQMFFFLYKILWKQCFYHCTVINIYLHFPFTVQHMQVPQILLHGNPLVCDCHLEWLPSINEYGMEANSHDHLKVMDLAELECQLSHEENNFEEFMLVSQVRGLKYLNRIKVCSKFGL